MKYKVTADTLRVRKKANINAIIIGELSSGDIVECKGISNKEKWLNISNEKISGWSYHSYLEAVDDIDFNDTIKTITNIAAASSIAKYKWIDRGIAPIGYIEGMAVVFAMAYNKLKTNDPIILEMAKANTGNKSTVALAYYSQKFNNLGFSN